MSDSSSEDEYPPLKRMKPSGPTSFVTWNANGMVSRSTWNKDQLIKLLHETEGPDVLCLQEVRLKATSPTNRGTPLPSDYKSIKQVMESTVFANYHKFWSLAYTKYAGTLTLLHRRLKFPKHDAAFRLEAALDLLLKKYNFTREDVGIPAKKKSPSPKKKQSTMTSFFAPKKSSSKNGNITATSTEHQEEGRFQFFAFEGFDLINTYVPNNGTKEESFQRRRKWDEEMKTFFSQRKMILKKAAATERPLLWCGDMNVAKDYRDGTHWEKTGGTSEKTGNSDEPGIYEWWRDEGKCFVADAARKLASDRERGDRGIPSFTTNERIRFKEILREADLEDVWRAWHPDGITEDDNRKYKTQWDRPNWTWRGHLSKDGNAFQSKYQGKGQRLDYFLLSPRSLTSSVVDSCDILGYGTNRDGLYCGSDHCATMLKLKKEL